MVVRRLRYPQVDPRAAGMMTRAVRAVAAALPVARAAARAAGAGAALLVARRSGGWAGVRRATLREALRLGLGHAPLATVLWSAPAVGPGTPEVRVRRRLGPAVPFLVVVDAGRPVGAVLAGAEAARGLPRDAAAALAGLPPPAAAVLARAGAAAARRGWPLALVGGLVRDLLAGRAPDARDLDVVVEGDARALARAVAKELGTAVRCHDAFLTATVELVGGGRLDVATARRERYARPGALPAVAPAALTVDLGRRDFSVNALAIRLDGAARGQLLDPTGGLADLRRRRLRVLHPLSFVEDPTRVFRAARLAARLGYRLEPGTARLARAAVRLAPYPALSGDRLRREVWAALAEPDPAAAALALGRSGALRLVEPRHRLGRRARAALGALAARLAGLSLAAATREALWALALTADASPGVGDAWLARLGAGPTLRAAVATARRQGPALLAALPSGPRDREAVLRDRPEATVAWALVTAADGPARRALAEHLGRWRHAPPPLDGDDLQALGVAPGPALGRLLEGLRDARAEGAVTDRAGAVAWVRAAVARSDASRPPGSAGEDPERSRPATRGG
jgi:tRNA nucleotidyltransferase (CCA-adding enzyme)